MIKQFEKTTNLLLMQKGTENISLIIVRDIHYFFLLYELKLIIIIIIIDNGLSKKKI